MYRFILIAAGLMVLALIVVLAVSSVQPKADVVLINGAAVHDLDPAKMSWSHDIRTAYGLWEGLLTLDPKTLVPSPAVAESFTVSPDGRVYTFKLRPSARWSNGDPVTAEDFRFAWMRVLDPATASDYYGLMFVIAGAEEYYNARSAGYKAIKDKSAPPASRPDESAVAIRVKDAHTLEVTLVRPTPYFPELAAFATFLPVHRASMEKFLVRPAGAPAYYGSDWLQPGNLVTNGPFTLARWDFRYRLVLERNEKYWDRDNVPSKRLELLANPDVNTAFLAYQSGAADVQTNLPQAVAADLIRLSAEGKRSDIHVFPVWGTYYYRFNCKTGPMSDVRVRRALAMCVDREAIVANITRRGERAQTSFVTPGLNVVLGDDSPLKVGDRGPGWRVKPSGEHRLLVYVPADGLPYDPAAARKLLADAGYGPGGNKPFRTDAGEPVAVLINESTEHKAIAESVVHGWREKLGLDITIEALVSSIAGQRMDEHNFEIARSGWFTDYGDPTGFLDMFRSGDGNNDGQFDVPEYDRLLRQAADTTDPARRYELLHQAERLLVDQHAGLIPVYQYVGQFLYRPEIKGIWPNPKQQIMLKHLRKQ